MDAENMTLEDKKSLSIQDELIKAYSVKDLAALVDKYGQAAVDESIGLLRVEDFILDNATVEEKVSAGDTQGVNGDDPPRTEAVRKVPWMKSWKRQRLQIWCRKTARRIRMQRVRSDLTVSAAKRVWCPECVPGAIFLQKDRGKLRLPFTGNIPRGVLLRTE